MVPQKDSFTLARKHGIFRVFFDNPTSLAILLLATPLIFSGEGASQRIDEGKDQQSVTNLISNMKKELDLLSKKLEDRGLLSESVSNNRISGECFHRRAGSSRQKLMHIDNNAVIRVVKAMYNNQESNFDMVLKFEEFVDSDETSFLIYSTLYSEMDKSKHNSIVRLKILAKDLKEKFTESPCSSGDIKAKAASTLKSVVVKLKESASQQLQTCMLQGNSSLISDLLDNAFEFGYESWQEIISKVVHNVYAKVGSAKLIDYISTCKHIEQRIPGYTSIFNEMESAKYLDMNPALMKLAFQLKNDKPSIDTYAKSTDIKAKYEILKSRLPESISNAVLSPEVCIRSVAMVDEYMYSSEFYHNNDTDVGRYLFTWIPAKDSDLEPTKWTLIHLNDDVFYMKNTDYSDYLYASDIELALTHKLKAPFNSFAWKIIPHGNNAYLKNVRYTGYLFVDESLKYDDENRYVLVDKTGKIRPEAEWKIESCN